MSAAEAGGASTETVTGPEAAAMCEMPAGQWAVMRLRDRERIRLGRPSTFPSPVGTDETLPGRPYLYDRAEVEAWAKVRRRRGDRRRRHPSPRSHS